MESERQSFMEHASIQEDALPFRTLERAHRRHRLAVLELEAARVDLERAFEGLKAPGYVVRQIEPGDELEARAPIPPESFRAEMAA